MCGRAYSTYTEEELFLRYISKRPVKIPLVRPNYNIAPSQDIIVLRKVGEERQLDLFRWGLIPFWAKEAKGDFKMINARAETLREKPAFRTAYQKRRCIIPVTGFYEWKREQDRKRPYCIFMKDRSIMSLAGIWERWTPPDVGASDVVKDIYSVSIITTEANSLMKNIHDRIPVIFDPHDPKAKEAEEEWLDPSNQNLKDLDGLLRPCPSEILNLHEISTLVNSPRNNSADVLKPIDQNVIGSEEQH